jgi:anti-sigma factor RsiW
MSTSRGSTRLIADHVPDDRLENYSRGLLQEPQLGEVEEHLLICERCRMRLTEFDAEWGLNG